MTPSRSDLTGLRFGRWVVQSRGTNGKGGSYRWNCVCDCGSQKLVWAQSLKQGRSTSCGCYGQSVPLKHGAASDRKTTREYNSWTTMKRRCFNPSNAQYADYGGRGITVCERWLHSFEHFLADMGPRPENTTLDRWPNKNGNYEPGNCRWATRKEQQSNQRSNINISIEEITDTMAGWCRTLNLNPKAVSKRLQRGYSPHDALLLPMKKKAA